MKKKSFQGQNVIEYLLLTVAAVLVLFYVLNPKNSPTKTALEDIFNDTVKDISALNGELKFNTSP